MLVTLNNQYKQLIANRKHSLVTQIKQFNILQSQYISKNLKSYGHNLIRIQHSEDKCFNNKKNNMRKIKFLKPNSQQYSTNHAINKDSQQIINPEKKHIKEQKHINEQNHIDEQKIFRQQKSRLKHLNHNKQNQGSSQTTKANSRQKSRSNSTQSICCQVIPCPQWKHVPTKSKSKCINKPSPQISPIVRIIMLDWLFQLACQIQLPRQALYNCVEYIDKYVGLCQVGKRQYQKVGLACLFLATKLETISHPNMHTFLQAMDHQIDRQTLIQTQRNVVKSLKFKLNPPTLYQYMSLLLFMVKSFKSLYKNISWVNDLPQIQKNDTIYRKLFWILDGVIIQGLLFKHYQKQDICFAILYLSIKIHNQQIYQKQGLSSTFHSEIAYNPPLNLDGLAKNSQLTSQIDNFNISYQCFMSYATTSNKIFNKQFNQCVGKLNKWLEYQCLCGEKGFYHPQLRDIALLK